MTARAMSGRGGPTGCSPEVLTLRGHGGRLAVPSCPTAGGEPRCLLQIAVPEQLGGGAHPLEAAVGDHGDPVRDLQRLRVVGATARPS